MFAGQFVKLGEDGGRRHFLAINRDGVTAFKPDFDVLGCVWRVLRVNRALINIIGRFVGRVLQHFAFRGCVQQIGIDRKRSFAALVFGNWDLVFLGKFDQFGPARQIPLAPRGDHLDIRVQRVSREFKADLIVAFAGGAMGDRIGAFCGSNFDQTFGNQWTCD